MPLILRPLPSSLKPYTGLAIAVVLGFAMITSLIMSIKQWQAEWALTEQKPVQALNLPTTQPLNPDLIINAHLFGQTLTSDVPVSNLQYHVTGIVAIDNDKSQSRAYIASADQNAKIYRSGDKLPSGVKVYTITPNAVILDNDGQLEKLPLSRERLTFKRRQQEESF